LEPWSPCQDRDGEWHLNTVIDGPDGLVVSLDRGKRSTDRLIAQFGWVPAYRHSPHHVYSQSPEVRSLLVVVESDYLRWLRSATLGVFEQSLSHYLFLTVDGAVDVLSSQPPHVSIAAP